MTKLAKIITGIDEAGRGSLAGGIFAGAVILPQKTKTNLLKDSKKLSVQKREEAFEWICKYCDWAVGTANSEEVDDLGVKKATRLAMGRAITKLAQRPQLLHIDGNDGFSFEIDSIDFIKGDERFAEISAASIVAKVLRDQEMEKFAKDFPLYGFEKNKGYGASEHLKILKKEGPCQIHRKTYEPLRTWLHQTEFLF